MQMMKIIKNNILDALFGEVKMINTQVVGCLGFYFQH